MSLAPITPIVVPQIPAFEVFVILEIALDPSIVKTVLLVLTTNVQIANNTAIVTMDIFVSQAFAYKVNAPATNIALPTLPVSIILVLATLPTIAKLAPPVSMVLVEVVPATPTVSPTNHSRERNNRSNKNSTSLPFRTC
ncbi:hypothetical protein KC963_03470 [Candidatus Saccharibacteria bacterium]|nr:hypothetical protein [Candidatus Saccharibacteria bacterium]